MMTPTRIVRMIGIAGLVGWMVMVGWVAKSSHAQNSGQNLPDLPPAAAKPAPEPPKLNAGDGAALTPLAPEAPASPVVDFSRNPPPPLPPAKPTVIATNPQDTPAPVRVEGALSDPETSRTAESHPATTGDDPEQAAQSFVERNQKEAEEHLKALTAEAQQLRNRLAKLESGIKKWQNLVNALKSSQGQTIASSATGADDAGDLEPIRPGGKTDKRVKWATATSTANAAGTQAGDHIEPAQPPAAEQLTLPVAVPGSVPR